VPFLNSSPALLNWLPKFFSRPRPVETVKL
jgi:hypothetical protein